MLQDKINKIIDAIQNKLKSQNYVLAAIDGRCGAGKTTLAEHLREILQCNVIHTDHFFLRPEQRTTERLKMSGENIDHERLRSEVLIPLKENAAFFYRPYDCKTQSLKNPIEVLPNKITIIEGSYSCHSKLWYFYDLHIFVDIDPKTQMSRIISRNGITDAKIFQDKWIPLEENYFADFRIKEKCELIFS